MNTDISVLFAQMLFRRVATKAVAALLLLSGTGTLHAQSIPPIAVSTTPTWAQNFSGISLSTSSKPSMWLDLDGDKDKAFPADSDVQTCPIGAPVPIGNNASTHCFQVGYNDAGGQAGINRDAPTVPVFATPVPGSPDCAAAGTATSGLPCVGWVPASGSTTNTGTDVVQQDFMVNARINPVSPADPISESATPATTLDPNHAYTLSYNVYFEPGFDFAKGGKLPGLSANDFDSGCTDDGSVKRTPHTWSERVMWRENGRVELYSYDQSRPSGNCGIDQLVNALPGDPAYEYPEVVPGNGGSVFRFQTGIWYTITLSVAVNDNNAVIYATDGSGNTLLDEFGDPIVIGANGLVNLTISTGGQAAPFGTGTVVGSIQYNNVALRDECDDGTTTPVGSSPVCGSPVPDTAAAQVNGVFFSTFFGGNETKRLTCLNDTLPSGSPSTLTQSIYEELCASQRVAYIFPTNTWVPQTVSQASFGQFIVYPGYSGLLPSSAPTWPSSSDLTSMVSSANEIDLCWGPASAGANPIAGYKVYSNGGVLLGQVGPSALGTAASSCPASSIAFPVTNIAGVPLSAPLSSTNPSQSYYFFVKAYDSAGNQSEFSNETFNTVSLTTPAPTHMLAPGSVTSNVLPNGVTAVFWAPQLNAVSYNVYRNYNSANPTSPIVTGIQPASACGALPAQEQFFDNTGLAPGQSYTYTVTAVNPSYTPAESAQSLPTTATPSTSSAAPSGLYVSVAPPYCQSIVAGASTQPYKISLSGSEATSASVNSVSTWPSSGTALEFGALYSALPTGMSVSLSGTSSVSVQTGAATPLGTYPINLIACPASSCSTSTTGAVWTQLVTVVAPAAPTPSPTPTAGTYVSASSVTFTAASGAAIYYTTDGSTPTSSSNSYTGPITLSGNTMVSAIAVINNTPSATAIGLYTGTGTGTTTPAVSVAPTSGSVTAGSSASASVTTSGFTGSVSLTTSAPSGVTAAVSSSTLTVITTSSTAAGTYMVTVTGTGGAQTATAHFTLTVTASTSPPPPPPPAGTVLVIPDSYTVVRDTSFSGVGFTVSPAGTVLGFTPDCWISGGSARSAVGTYPTECDGKSKTTAGVPVNYGQEGTFTVVAAE
jgi:Chitobiase/beta-hexosaminidase C-terminal domain